MASAKKGSLKKRIETLHRKAGFDMNLSAAINHHLNVMKESGFKDAKDIQTREEMSNLLMSKFFLDKLEMFLVKKYRCNVDENSNWPVPVLPAEVFIDPKLPEEYRKTFFFKCLKVGDVLDCRVSSVQSAEYQLRVIHKYGTTRILDDLNLTVTLKRTKKELINLKKDLLASELIRVAVSQIEKETEKVLVTLDEKSLDIGIDWIKLPELGRISDKELPSYVLDPPDPEKYSSYADYLDSRPEFKNPTLLNDIIKDFGLDPLKVYSFYPTLNRLGCPEEMTGQYLLRESKKKESRSYADAAVKKHDEKKYDEALALVEKSIQTCPKNDPSLGFLYHLKATIYSHQGPPGLLMHALCEAAAYKFEPTNEDVKKSLSKLLFMAANGCYKKKNYKKAAYLAEKALEVCDNALAETLLDVLKTKHAEQLMNLDEKSVYQLQEKKRQLVTELKKMDIR